MHCLVTENIKAWDEQQVKLSRYCCPCVGTVGDSVCTDRIYFKISFIGALLTLTQRVVLSEKAPKPSNFCCPILFYLFFVLNKLCLTTRRLVSLISLNVVFALQGRSSSFKCPGPYHSARLYGARLILKKIIATSLFVRALLSQ